jgi:hypothetical protein
MLALRQSFDSEGNVVAGAFPQSDTIDALYFAAAGAQSDNVPAGARFVAVSLSAPVAAFLKMDGAAVVPAANVSNGSASEAIPVGNAQPLVRELNGATTVGIAVGAACAATLAYYA